MCYMHIYRIMVSFTAKRHEMPNSQQYAYEYEYGKFTFAHAT